MVPNIQTAGSFREDAGHVAVSRPIVYVVDDEPLVRSYLARLLAFAGYETALFAAADELLESVSSVRPGCLILDVFLPGLSGLELQRILTEQCSHLPIIFISGHGTIPLSVQAMKNGAFDFLTKPLDTDKLIGAIEGALNASVKGLAESVEAAALEERVRSLSPRQAEVLRLVAAGRLNKQIAAELQILEKTVKVHRARAMQKLGVRSVAELVRVADRVLLVPASPGQVR